MSDSLLFNKTVNKVFTVFFIYRDSRFFYILYSLGFEKKITKNLRNSKFEDATRYLCLAFAAPIRGVKYEPVFMGL